MEGGARKDNIMNRRAATGNVRKTTISRIRAVTAWVSTGDLFYI